MRNSLKNSQEARRNILREIALRAITEDIAWQAKEYADRFYKLNPGGWQAEMNRWIIELSWRLDSPIQVRDMLIELGLS